MKIQYLGTAAAEGIPAIFCECETCKIARMRGGKHIRTRSQAIIDDTLLIDFPADTYMHYLLYNFPLQKINSCIVTHSHQDHLYPQEINMRKDGFSHIDEKNSLTFYSGKASCVKLLETIENGNIPESIINIKCISAYETFKADGYMITPIRAAHDIYSDPVVFLIEKDDKVLFYINDTSDFNDEAWDYLRKCNKKIKLASFDCTEGDKKIDYEGHMNLQRCIEMREKLTGIGLVDENTICVLNHFSHNGTNVNYDEFSEIAQKYNFVVSYDGMKIEF